MIRAVINNAGLRAKDLSSRFDRLISLLGSVDISKLDKIKISKLLEVSQVTKSKEDFLQFARKDIKEIKNQFKKSIYRFKISKATIDNSNKMVSGVYSNLGNGVRGVENAMLTASLLGGDVSDVVGVIKKSKNYIKTELNTDISSLYRKYSNDVANDNFIKLYKYVGVSDGLVRQFCSVALEMSPRTLEEWNKLDNGTSQPGPVSVRGGGYNCRHFLMPVLDD